MKYVDSWLHIPKNEVSEQDMSGLKKIFTVNEKDFYSGEERESKHYQETESEYLFPRYALQTLQGVENRCQEGQDISIESEIKYRFPEQKEAVNFILNNDCGTIKCTTGFGKTVVAIKAISEIKKKTLIFVDVYNLGDQWKERFREHSNLKEEDIGKLDTKLDLDHPIVITTIQSVLARLRLDKEHFTNVMKEANFGMVIFDEVHCLIGPEKFTEAVSVCFCKKLIGLSATPYKNFEREHILMSWLSRSMYVYDKYEIIPKIKIIRFRNNIPLKTKRYIMWGGYFRKQRYYKQLIKHAGFLKMVCTLIKSGYTTQRKTLLLVGGIKNEVLQTIQQMLIQEFTIPENDVALYVGGTSRDLLARPIILSNFSMAYKGLDEKRLDTLIVMTSVASHTYIEQSIGRIVREHPDKKEPTVVDFVDEDEQLYNCNAMRLFPANMRFPKRMKTVTKIQLNEKGEEEEVEIKVPVQEEDEKPGPDLRDEFNNRLRLYEKKKFIILPY